MGKVRVYHGSFSELCLQENYTSNWIASKREAKEDTGCPVYFWLDEEGNSAYNKAKNSALMAAAIRGEMKDVYIYHTDIDLNFFNEYFHEDPIHQGAFYVDGLTLANSIYDLKEEHIETEFTRLHAPFVLSMTKEEELNKDIIPEDIWNMYLSLNSTGILNEEHEDLDNWEMLQPIMNFIQL